MAAARWRSALYILIGVLAALAALELLFRVLPVSSSARTGYYIDPVILTYPAHEHFTRSFGWNLENAHRQRANNFGFLADHDFVYDPQAVGLIGDSFVEGSMLPRSDRLGPQLERHLGGRQVYAMGIPGTSLLDYAERVRFAASHFGIRDFVLLLEHGDIAQSLCGSGNEVGPCLDKLSLELRIETVPPPGRLRRILRSSALADYFFTQIMVDPARMRDAIFGGGSWGRAGEARVDPELPTRVVDAVLREFFARIRPYRRGRLVLVLMADPDPSDPVYSRLIDVAGRENAVVVAIEPQLHALTARTGLSEYVSPHDHHLNGLALGIVAGAVADVLDSGQGSASKIAESRRHKSP